MNIPDEDLERYLQEETQNIQHRTAGYRQVLEERQARREYGTFGEREGADSGYDAGNDESLDSEEEREMLWRLWRSRELPR